MVSQDSLESAILSRLRQRASDEGRTLEALIDYLLQTTPSRSATAEDALDGACALILINARLPNQPVTYASRAFSAETGYAPAELLGKNLRFLYAEDTDQPALERLDSALREGAAADVTLRSYRKDGSMFWSHLKLTPRRTATGELAEFVAILTNVTQQKQLETALEASSEAYRFFTDNTTDGISVHDRAGRFIYANETLARMTAYTREELVSLDSDQLGQIVHPEDRPLIWAHVQESISRGQPIELVEFRLRRKDGSYGWVESSSNPIFDDQGVITQSIAITRDISKRKEAEKAIRYQAMLLQQSSDAIIATDRDLRITSWNDSAARIYGWTEAEVLGKNLDELLETEWTGESQSQAQTILMETGAWQGGLRQRTRSGDHRLIAASVHVVYDDTGEIIGGVTVNRDITRRKQAEDALRESEERYKLLTEMMSDYALSARVNPDRTLEIEWVTGAFSDITGYDPSEIGSMSTLKDTHPDDLERVLSDVRRTLENQPTTTEYRVYNNRTRDYVWLAISRRPIWDEAEGRVVRFFSVAKDITERKRAEEALRQSEARLRSLVETQTAYVVRTDMEGRYTYCNQPFVRRYGWVVDELIGAPSLVTILPVDHEKTHHAVEACIAAGGKPVQVLLRKPRQDSGHDWTLWEFAALKDGGGNITEIQCIGFDISEQVRAEESLREERQLFIGGTTVVFKWQNAPGWPVTYVSPNVYEQFGYSPDEFMKEGLLFAPLVHPDDLNPLLFRLKQLDEKGILQFEQEYRLRHKNGEYRWVSDFTTIVVHEEGRVKQYQGYLQDITEQKAARDLLLEQSRIAVSLQREKEQNATTQRVIANLAHDLRTPLAVIGSTKEILSRYFDQIDPDQRRERLETIGKQLQYVSELLNDLTLVTGASLNERQLQRAPVNLVTLCHVIVKDMQETVAARHRLSFYTDDTISTVDADEVLIHRILINLLSNAVKYSEEGSEIRLELRQERDQIVLRVIDHGVGIASADFERIFEPFYRVEAVREISGTGLGLSIVRDCVHMHGGTIGVESTPGEGSTFTVSLPLSLQSN